MLKFYNRRDLRARGYDVSNQTLIRWESAGRFPKRVVDAGGARVLWVAAEVDAVLAQLVANRSGPVAPVRANDAVRAQVRSRKEAKQAEGHSGSGSPQE